MDKKKCVKCDKPKPLEEYHKRRDSRDGRFSECKACYKLRCRAYSRTAKAKARVRAYNATERGRAVRAAAGARYYSKHSERVKARARVTYEIGKGAIVRGPCEACGARDDVEAHHDDYSKPLEVRWLCRKHHAEHHLG